MNALERLEKLTAQAREEFGELDGPEGEVLRCFTEGESARFKSGEALRGTFLAWLYTSKLAEAIFPVRTSTISGARITGALHLAYARLTLPVFLEKCEIEGPLFLASAEIPALSLAGCRTGAIDASQAQVSGSVFLNEKFEAVGEVDFNSAGIAGQLDCSGGSFRNPGGVAIKADSIRTGHVFLNNGFRAEGEVGFISAVITGELNCCGGRFSNPTGCALQAGAARIHGSVHLEGCEAEGEVSFQGARIDGAFNGKDCKITKLDLRYVHSRVLIDSELSWPSEGNLRLDGFVYEQIYGSAPRDAERRIRWLNLQPSDTYCPQPFEQLAKVLESFSQDKQARAVHVAKEKARARSGTMSKPARLWHALLYLFVGYGYYPHRALIWMLGFLVFGTWVFQVGYENRVMARRVIQMKVPEPVNSTNSVGGISFEHPWSALSYSIDSFVPLIKLGDEEMWRPTTTPLIIYRRFHVAFGWLLTSLLAYAFSRAVNK